MKSYDVTIQIKPLCLNLLMVLFVCQNFTKFHKMKFEHLVEFAFLHNFAVKGLRKSMEISLENLYVDIRA